MDTEVVTLNKLVFSSLRRKVNKIEPLERR